MRNSFILPCLLIALFFHSVPLRVQGQKEISIGNQTWKAFNVNVNTFRNGDRIPEAKTKTEWIKAYKNKSAAWCFFDNNPDHGLEYGRLYNWYAVADARGLCPAGWHVPSDAEWTKATQALGGKDVAASNLYESKGGQSVAGSQRLVDGTFPDFLGYEGWLWTSSEADSDNAWSRFINADDPTLYRKKSGKGSGGIVRCIKEK